MANLLDLNLVGFLAPIIILIFIWTLVFALLNKLKLFGDNKGMNGLIAVCVGLLVIINVDITLVLVNFIPWVFAFLLLLVFIFMIFMFMGMDEKHLTKMIKDEPTIWVPVLAAIVIMFLVSMTSVFGPFLQVTDKPGFWEVAKRTLFHPRILGALFIILVASQVIRAFEIPVGKSK